MGFNQSTLPFPHSLALWIIVLEKFKTEIWTWQGLWGRRRLPDIVYLRGLLVYFLKNRQTKSCVSHWIMRIGRENLCVKVSSFTLGAGWWACHPTKTWNHWHGGWREGFLLFLLPNFPTALGRHWKEERIFGGWEYVFLRAKALGRFDKVSQPNCNQVPRM